MSSDLGSDRSAQCRRRTSPRSSHTRPRSTHLRWSAAWRCGRRGTSSSAPQVSSEILPPFPYSIVVGLRSLSPPPLRRRKISAALVMMPRWRPARAVRSRQLSSSAISIAVGLRHGSRSRQRLASAKPTGRRHFFENDAERIDITGASTEPPASCSGAAYRGVISDFPVAVRPEVASERPRYRNRR